MPNEFNRATYTKTRTTTTSPQADRNHNQATAFEFGSLGQAFTLFKTLSRPHPPLAPFLTSNPPSSSSPTTASSTSRLAPAVNPHRPTTWRRADSDKTSLSSLRNCNITGGGYPNKGGRIGGEEERNQHLILELLRRQRPDRQHHLLGRDGRRQAQAGEFTKATTTEVGTGSPTTERERTREQYLRPPEPASGSETRNMSYGTPTMMTYPTSRKAGREFARTAMDMDVEGDEEDVIVNDDMLEVLKSPPSSRRQQQSTISPPIPSHRPSPSPTPSPSPSAYTKKIGTPHQPPTRKNSMKGLLATPSSIIRKVPSMNFRRVFGVERDGNGDGEKEGRVVRKTSSGNLLTSGGSSGKKEPGKFGSFSTSDRDRPLPPLPKEFETPTSSSSITANKSTAMTTTGLPTPSSTAKAPKVKPVVASKPKPPAAKPKTAFLHRALVDMPAARPSRPKSPSPPHLRPTTAATPSSGSVFNRPKSPSPPPSSFRPPTPASLFRSRKDGQVKEREGGEVKTPRTGGGGGGGWLPRFGLSRSGSGSGKVKARAKEFNREREDFRTITRRALGLDSPSPTPARDSVAGRSKGVGARVDYSRADSGPQERPSPATPLLIITRPSDVSERPPTFSTFSTSDEEEALPLPPPPPPPLPPAFVAPIPSAPTMMRDEFDSHPPIFVRSNTSATTETLSSTASTMDDSFSSEGPPSPTPAPTSRFQRRTQGSLKRLRSFLPTPESRKNTPKKKSQGNRMSPSPGRVGGDGGKVSRKWNLTPKSLFKARAAEADLAKIAAVTDDLQDLVRGFKMSGSTGSYAMSSTSDVPDDLQDLINNIPFEDAPHPSVSHDGDETGPLGTPTDPTTEFTDSVLRPFGFVEKSAEQPDDETSSFEGDVSTAGQAAAALQFGQMASHAHAEPLPPLPGVREDGSGSRSRFSRRQVSVDSMGSIVGREGRMRESMRESIDSDGNRMRDSVRDYLSMERPTVGEKMMDEIDFVVSLDPIAGSPSPTRSSRYTHRQTDSLDSFYSNKSRDERPSGVPFNPRSSVLSQQSSSSVMSSPCPAGGRRRTINRYSAASSYNAHESWRRRRSTRSMSETSDTPSSPSVSSPSAGEASHRPIGRAADAADVTMETSMRSSVMSISSMNSSPCPRPPTRRVHMLTGNRFARRPPPPPAPVFKFPQPPEVDPKDPLLSNSQRGNRVLLDLHVQLNSPDKFRALKSEGKPAPSPRFVRPFPNSANKSGIERPRPLSSLAFAGTTIPPDTPPPSSPSSGSSRSTLSTFSSSGSSLDHIPRGHMPIQVKRGSGGYGHHRQISRSSIILQETIQEEDSRLTDSPVSPGVLSHVDERVSMMGYAQPERVSIAPPSATISSDSLVDKSPPADPHSPAPVSGLRLSTDFEDDRLVEAEAKWYRFCRDADYELRQSRERWPDTEASKWTMMEFVSPRSHYDVLQYLFDSQDRFQSIRNSSITASTLSTEYMEDSPPTPELVSDVGEDDADVSSLKELQSTQLRPELALLPLDPKPCGHRVPLAVKSANVGRSPIRPISAKKKKRGASIFVEGIAPIGSPDRMLSLVVQGKAYRARKSPKSAKTVPVDAAAFLGRSATVRRRNAFDAARRKLEGFGTPDEQEDEEESDTEMQVNDEREHCFAAAEQSGVLEAGGEADGYYQTPKLTASQSLRRPRRRPPTSQRSKPTPALALPTLR